MVEFKTYDEQIEILKNRGLKFEDESLAKSILIKENYYNVINGYKDKFIKDVGTKYERFKEDVSFDDIYNLYKFDRDLKKMFLNRILLIENTIKSVIAHIFAEHHRERKYLDKKNFGNKDCLKLRYTIDEVISNIQQTIKQQQDNGNKMINHYISKYNFVPTWVLVNILSLGQISKFFSVMFETEQREVCKSLSNIFNNRIDIKDLKIYLGILTQARNICAHDLRLYDFSSNLVVSQNAQLMKKLQHNKIKGVFALIFVMSKLMGVFESQQFILDFISVTKRLDAIRSLNKNVIFKAMGFSDGIGVLIYI